MFSSPASSSGSLIIFTFFSYFVQESCLQPQGKGRGGGGTSCNFWRCCATQLSTNYAIFSSHFQSFSVLTSKLHTCVQASLHLYDLVVLYTQFQTKMLKDYTCFQTKNAEKDTYSPESPPTSEGLQQWLIHVNRVSVLTGLT